MEAQWKWKDNKIYVVYLLTKLTDLSYSAAAGGPGLLLTNTYTHPTLTSFSFPQHPFR
jgi:hypothetical protein